MSNKDALKTQLLLVIKLTKTWQTKRFYTNNKVIDFILYMQLTSLQRAKQS